MPCGTIVGQQLKFGVPEDEVGLVTTSISVVNKADKKEVRDHCGCVVSVVYYNRTSEVTIEGYGSSNLGAANTVIGTALSLTGSYELAGAIFVDEISTDFSNEDFCKTTIKATAYECIT